jgi:hypothetical protein
MRTWARQFDEDIDELPRWNSSGFKNGSYGFRQDRPTFARVVTGVFYTAAFLLALSVFFVQTNRILPQHKTVIHLSLREPERVSPSKVLEGDRRRAHRPPNMFPLSPLVQQYPLTHGILA